MSKKFLEINENDRNLSSGHSSRKSLVVSPDQAYGSTTAIQGSVEDLWPEVLSEIRRILPLQNPLKSFLHNNLLMAWEDHSFWDGLTKASELYGSKSRKSLERFFAEKKISYVSHRNLRVAIDDCLDHTEKFLTRGPHHSVVVEWIAKLMQKAPVPPLDLIRSAKEGSLSKQAPSDKQTLSTDVFSKHHGNKNGFDGATIEWLCHLLESALDQGISSWHNPAQNDGLLSFFKAWLKGSWLKMMPWQSALASQLPSFNQSPTTYILNRWKDSGLDAMGWQRVCLRLLFQVKGWAGMVNKAETEHGTLLFRSSAVKLEELLAILLLIAEAQQLDLTTLSAPFGRDYSLSESLNETIDLEKILKKLNIIEEQASLDDRDALELRHALEKFDWDLTYRAWHIASEIAMYTEVVSDFLCKSDSQLQEKSETTSSPDFQVLFCMDDREESLRRHLESVSPRCETFGVLGNFGLDIRFVSMNHPRPQQHCPPVVTPRRVLIEKPAVGQPVRGKIGQAILNRHFKSSRRVVSGAATSLAMGPLAFIPLVVNAMLPRHVNRLHKSIEKRIFPDCTGAIDLTRRTDPTYGDVGYTLEEQADMVRSILRAAPLVPDRLAKLIIVLGHESMSVNNPFLQAYGCGACSGHSGGPNARIFASMANDSQVRKILATQGFDIPSTVRFVPAVHDTAQDKVRYFDLEKSLINDGDQERFLAARSAIEIALDLNAGERCRFFENAGKDASPTAQRKHVVARTMDLSEVRPEYGHARTFMAVFGRRALTKKMNLDRRAFLLSYDSSTDPSGEVLAGLITGALPVVANITLDYFFSSLDPQAFGAGSKLPLNVSGLLGVMTGSRGDLRVGLASQMVEIHEPLRALALIEGSIEIIEQAVFGHRRLKNLVSNGWIRIGAIDPSDSSKILFWTPSGWKPPQISLDQALMSVKIEASI